MTPHDDCRDEDVDALLAGHALGDLDPGERQRLASLLEQNPALRARLDEFQTTLELLPLALPATVEPPPRLRRRLLAREDSPGRVKRRLESGGRGRSRSPGHRGGHGDRQPEPQRADAQ
jgi:anti-sigma factor RsiW